MAHNCVSATCQLHVLETLSEFYYIVIDGLEYSIQTYSQSHVSANACILRMMSPLVLDASVRLRIKVIGLAPSLSLVQRPMSKCSTESGFVFDSNQIDCEVRFYQISSFCWTSV